MSKKGKSKVIRILSSKERGLFNAIISEDVTAVRQLVEAERVHVNIQDVFQRTPLMRACVLTGHDERSALVALLLQRGADVNLTDNHDRTALMILCKESRMSVPILESILETNRVEPNVQDDCGDTALIHAVQADNADAVRELLAWRGFAQGQKVDVDLKNNEDEYALLLAAKQQNPDICKLLVRRGHADYSNIPLLLRRYLPPECQETNTTKAKQVRFEEYRKNAQDLPGSPYDVDEDFEAELDKILAAEEEKLAAEEVKGRENSRRNWKKATSTIKAANAFEQALKAANLKKSVQNERSNAKPVTPILREKSAASPRKAPTDPPPAAAEPAADIMHSSRRASQVRQESPEDQQERASTARSRSPIEDQPSTSLPNKRTGSNWEKVTPAGVARLRTPPPLRRNKPKKGSGQMVEYKTKSGRVIFPNATHDRGYGKITAIREGKDPALPKTKGKLPAIAEVAARKRKPISTT